MGRTLLHDKIGISNDRKMYELWRIDTYFFTFVNVLNEYKNKIGNRQGENIKW